MAHIVNLSKRDLAVLCFLEMTPGSAAQVRKASVTFRGEPFRDERRVRERLQTLAAAGLIRSFPAAIGGGGTMQYYRLSPEGFRALYPDSDQIPARTLVSEVAPSRFQHALTTS